MKHAHVIGAGPNGLAAAIALARAGVSVQVWEAEAEPGGAARTLELTLPGFLHDFGSAVHPMAVGSPFFHSLPMEQLGLEWLHSDAPLAHPLDDGTAVMLERSISATAQGLGRDGAAWRAWMEPVVEHWQDFLGDTLGSLLRVPRHPLRMARFGWEAIQPARRLANHHLRGMRARALFAGLVGHSFMSFDQPLSSSVGLVLGAAGHAVGWPVPRGGSGALTRALVRQLEALGGVVHTHTRIDAERFLSWSTEETATLFDTSPQALVEIAGSRVKPVFHGAARRFARGPGVFKIDYALNGPVPWRAAECNRAVCLHLGGTFEEIAEAEDEVMSGRAAERPLVLVAQPSTIDPTRAPAGQQVLWAYCHVPNGSELDMTGRIESQIERFAPGFRDCILAKKTWTGAQLEARDANLAGGDIMGGALNLRQFLFRPSLLHYATGTPGIYLCSASTPPGGGVHGMCGYLAAQAALREMR